MPIRYPIRLLVIDQDTLGENTFKQELNHSTYQSIKFTTLHDGVPTIRTWNPDVILINILQAASKGWKLCHEIRQYSQVPILVLAAASDPNSIALWLDAGADDFLTRPISSDILCAHLQKLTRRSKLVLSPRVAQ